LSEEIKILGIESSCDETSAAVVVNGRKIISDVISSQIEIHKQFGGVVPEVAARKHIENIDYVISECLEKSNMTFKDIDCVAVTYGPGLVGALLVGLSYAKGICLANKKPLVGVHHIRGHVCANYLEDYDFKPPFICLVVSGGHTHLVLVKDYLKYEIIGRTRDDAAGEAFDKISRALGLGYPGGPNIDRLAKLGDRNKIDFPRAVISDNKYDFSFSGVKSAVLNYLNKSKMKDEEIIKEDVAASFQLAVVDVLVEKTICLAKEMNYDKIAIAGGVACNSFLRERMGEACAENNFTLKIPAPVYCTDNAAMIASAGYFELLDGNFSELSLNAVPNLMLT